VQPRNCCHRVAALQALERVRHGLLAEVLARPGVRVADDAVMGRHTYEMFSKLWASS
jgi:hypothetical protein